MSDFKLNFDYKKIYFIGIGGVSMSALALILKTNNYIVCGSDVNKTAITNKLEDQNILVNFGQVKENITSDIDLIVHTAAIKEDNEELIVAKKLGIKIMDRAALLGLIMKNYEYPIAVSGVHGKSTTTSMITEIFFEAGLNPTIAVGGNLSSIGGNLYLGDDKYFIFESCEYFDSFLQFFPHVATILNIDLDHVDYFKDIHQIRYSFNKFAKNISEDGFLVINNTIDEVEKITKGVKANIFTFGDENSNLFAINIVYNKNGCCSFDIVYNKSIVGHINLKVVGNYNIMNALSAVATAIIYEIPLEKIIKALENFTGIDRRFQLKGMYNNISVIDDYAHHPTEIKCTLDACKKIGDSKVWAVFQPHTFSRTADLLNDFGNAFDDADNIVLLDIYSAREPFTDKIHSKDILNLLLDKHKNAYYFDSFEKAEDFLMSNVTDNEIILTMGAGNVFMVGNDILRRQGAL